MSDHATSLTDRLSELKTRMDAQGVQVRRIVETAVEALFEGSQDDARRVIDADRAVDLEDIAIERAAVSLLQDACDGPPGGMNEAQIRLVLTIVKVNNELERIADLMVTSAEHASQFRAMREGAGIPPAFRVLANSVIGIVQQTVRSFAEMNSSISNVVLKSDDTTEAFKRELLRDVESRLVRSEASVDDAFALHTAAASFARTADHCTNIAEQVIYVDRGMIVRHENDRWTDPTAPS